MIVMAFNRSFRERPDPKLPDYSLPCPSLSDFGRDDFFIRYKEDNPQNDDAVFLKGVGNPNANIMFLAASPLEEDADATTSDPRLLKSGPGVMFRRLCLENGIDIDKEYYTTVCKYPLPRKYKLKPKASDISYCASLLAEEMELIKPKIIVCIGKEPVLVVLGLNLKLQKIEECWFYSEKHNARVYVITSMHKAYYKPEYYDKLAAEIGVLRDCYLASAQGLSMRKIKQEYLNIDSRDKLVSWLDMLKREDRRVYGVDCEWRGQNFVDGNLRSIQFCWDAGKAAFVNLFDEQNKWVFDCGYDEVKSLLQAHFNRPEIKYYGHNFCADAVWMKHHLGLDVFDNKCILDTQYAFQVANEYEDLSLKKLAAKYTDMGRYDAELILWFARQKGLVEEGKKLEVEGLDDEGYGSVPTEILYPYGCRDVDATFRLASIAYERLKADDTLEYYLNIRHPFVTEGFAYMMEAGLPIDAGDADKMRLSFLACNAIMHKLFIEMMRKEAGELLVSNAVITAGEARDPIKLLKYVKDITASDEVGQPADYCHEIKKLSNAAIMMKLKPSIEHYVKCRLGMFNYNSSQDKTIWLFKVKNYVPIKTTKNEDAPAIPWEKVMQLPPKEQAMYTPAVDKDTLKVYADNGDDCAMHLLQLSAVNTITKTFLKGQEGGLQKFIASDGRLHCSFACTETGRNQIAPCV